MEKGKRANGQVAVYLRGDGRWEGQLRLPAGGRKSVYAQTRRDLPRKLREASWMLAQGLPVSSRNQTMTSKIAAVTSPGSPGPYRPGCHTPRSSNKDAHSKT